MVESVDIQGRVERPRNPAEDPRNVIGDIIKKSATAATRLQSPTDDQWVIYELARCAIFHLCQTLPAVNRTALLEESLDRLTNALDEAIKVRV